MLYQLMNKDTVVATYEEQKKLDNYRYALVEQLCTLETQSAIHEVDLVIDHDEQPFHVCSHSAASIGGTLPS